MTNPEKPLQLAGPRKLEPVDPENAVATRDPENPMVARTNSVSLLLAGAYAKASTLELTEAERSQLAADFPLDAFEFGARGDANLPYIEHAYVRERLFTVFGPGQWAVINRRSWLDEPGGWLYADVVLLVRGCYVGECIGAMRYGGNNKRLNYADAIKGAESDALGRIAGTQLGVGLQLWKKEFTRTLLQHRANGSTQSATSSTQNAPRPAATTVQVLSHVATNKTRSWAIAELCKTIPIEELEAYLVAMSWGTSAETWELAKVPITRVGVGQLANIIIEWTEATKGLGPEAGTGEPPTGADDFSEPFWNEIICVPRAGTKRVDYLKAPDTIRSLYEAAKAGDNKLRHRLFGLANEWAPSPWVDKEGNERPPNSSDVKCRAALDAFLEWERANGGDQ